MGWVKIDDAFLDHSKWLRAGPLAGFLGLCGIAWSNRNLTDGAIPREQVPRLVNYHDAVSAGMFTETPDPFKLADRLVEVGLWDAVADGYEIHDYLEHQTSAEQIRKKRDKETERGKRRRAAGMAAAAPTPVDVQRGRHADSATEEGRTEDETPKESRATAFETDFDATWEHYPRKESRKAALRAYQARRRAGASAVDLAASVRHYATAVEGQERRYIKHGATFFGPDDHWRDYLAPVPAEPVEPVSARPEDRGCPLCDEPAYRCPSHSGEEWDAHWKAQGVEW